jgi:hypothetical protein
VRELIPDPDKYRSTYLIQSLNPPSKHWGGKIGPFDFGGGGSGLSNEAQKLLCQFFSFDYMGAAEYEFGAVAGAFNAIRHFRVAELLVAKAIEVTGPLAERDRPNGWLTRSKTKTKTTVYVLGCVNHLPKIEETIDSLLNGTKIQGEYGDPSPVSLKRGICLWDSLFDPTSFWKNQERRSFIGGVELDNGWMVFTDPNIFQQVCQLFDVPVPDLSKVVTYIPPKALLRTDDVDKRILNLFTQKAGVFLSFCEICNLIYDLHYHNGDVVADEHHGYCEQITKRLASLKRKKLISVDRKTKLYSKAKS